MSSVFTARLTCALRAASRPFSPAGFAAAALLVVGAAAGPRGAAAGGAGAMAGGAAAEGPRPSRRSSVFMSTGFFGATRCVAAATKAGLVVAAPSLALTRCAITLRTSFSDSMRDANKASAMMELASPSSTQRRATAFGVGGWGGRKWFFLVALPPFAT